MLGAFFSLTLKTYDNYDIFMLFLYAERGRLSNGVGSHDFVSDGNSDVSAFWFDFSKNAHVSA